LATPVKARLFTPRTSTASTRTRSRTPRALCPCSRTSRAAKPQVNTALRNCAHSELATVHVSPARVRRHRESERDFRVPARVRSEREALPPSPDADGEPSLSRRVSERLVRCRAAAQLCWKQMLKFVAVLLCRCAIQHAIDRVGSQADAAVAAVARGCARGSPRCFTVRSPDLLANY